MSGITTRTVSYTHLDVYKRQVLVCGKPHSGKSATLAALAEQMLAGRFMHLVTLESPVEYPIEAGKGLLSRRCIGKDTGSYKEGMDNLLHESADGVLIGELETPEAVQAALRDVYKRQISISVHSSISAIVRAVFKIL